MDNMVPSSEGQLGANLPAVHAELTRELRYRKLHVYHER
jgi:hypothetical protein